jgi:hypothetical protein
MKNESIKINTNFTNSKDLLKSLNINITKEAGKGGLGTAFLTDDGKLVKEIKMEYDDSSKNKITFKDASSIASIKNSKDTIERLNDEVSNAYKMAKINIGPKIYDAFCIIFDDFIVQYIVMERFEGSVFQLLKKIRIKSSSNLCSVVSQMIGNIEKQIYTGHLCCIDIKPENFVYKKKKSSYTIRMIDFDSVFCQKDPGNFILINYDKTAKKYNINTKDLVFAINLIQLFMFLIEDQSYCFEPFFRNGLFTEFIDRDDAKEILDDIFKDNVLFKRYMKVLERYNSEDIIETVLKFR